ncbi:hypothetical protein XELAEV_18043685mg [Xenopus laevis]|uniref:Reverse transcriptase zinc-binding domain-containing protein n=1 Tax=Xenopus laevis TaxID=8355 RepID=A0A974BXN2_XENLA|nr:hypothetical protein XELAEV_18043685mg [Xenopus laevis]
MGDCIKFFNGHRLPGKLFDNAWLALQGKLFLRGNVSYFNIVERFCPWGCGEEETIDHFLINCSVSHNLYDHVLTILGIKGICRGTYEERAYGIISRKHSLEKETLFIIFSVIRYHLWMSRCGKTFGREEGTMDLTVKKIQKDLFFIRFKAISKNKENINWWKFILHGKFLLMIFNLLYVKIVHNLPMI